MRQLKSKIFIVTIFIVVGILFFYKTKPKTNDADVQTAEKSAAVSPLKNNFNSALNKAAVSGDNTTASIPIDEVQNMNEAAFKNWIHEESKTLNSTHVNTDQKAIQMRALAQNLTAAQNVTLKEMGWSSTSTMNDKILSVYLLTLRQNDDVISSFEQTAKKGLTDNGPVTVHSEAEIKRVQELSLKYMVIDELARRAKSNAAALASLRALVSDAEAPEIRNYAQRKLKEIGL
ncbi:MAG: hypothetical protein H7061_00905 [Bdellovibrionaceae bacterium]|nr:hypothetical protein [Bdellovibrio sp.]